jgi:molybdenum cofactor biosynthesis enzyme MoaA
MEVQSLSIVIPAKCPNRCPFCVSHMNKENRKFHQLDDRVKYQLNVKKRMEFARDNGTNTLMLTSTGEPLENMEAIVDVLGMNRNLESPFKWIELQTSGVGLLDAIEKYSDWFADISTISLSVVDIFSSSKNAAAMQMPAVGWIEIDFVIAKLKEMGFNVRLSINLIDLYNHYSVEQIFQRLRKLGVDQVTFRKLYKSGEDTKQDKWIENHTADSITLDRIVLYIKDYGHELERLPFGAMKYSVHGISTVVDDDCMAKEVKDVMKYLIIREDGKLYTKWDDKGSLIF